MSSRRLSVSTTDIERCFAVMQELRPHLKAVDFVDRVRRQEEGGYRLLYLEEAGEIKAVAGFRISENLAWGKFLYVDDLVTRATEHGRGHGKALFEWLLHHAKTEGCEQLHLDSGVQRHDAHRFYLGRGMAITAHHFAVRLR
jgi:GNAT superfamily N-acetyltransferase